MKSSCLILTVVLMFVLGATGFGVTPSFQGVGDFADGNPYSIAAGVSADGKIVVGLAMHPWASEAFRWTSSGGTAGIGDLPGGDFYSAATGISANGSVVVGNSDSTPPVGQVYKSEAFRWTATGGMVGLGYLPGSDESRAAAVSGDGSVVVGYSSIGSSGYEAYRWTASGGMVGLGYLSTYDDRSMACGVSADGSVVVGFSASDWGYQGFRWTASTGMVGLGSGIGANAVSADGSVMVGCSEGSSVSQAFRWTASGGIVTLGNLPGGYCSTATAVSGDGSVIVGYDFNGSELEALYWTASGGMQDLKGMLTNTYGLNLPGWTLSEATGVSADGLTIVGWGTDPQGNTAAWEATIPEPATILLLGLGGLLKFYRRAT